MHTGQFFFDPTISDVVYTVAPYDTHTGRRMTNTQDGITAMEGLSRR